MPDGSDQLVIRTTDSIGDISAEDWDRCADTDNPFLSHAFLSALEESGSVGDKSGWYPQHVILEDEDGRVMGAAPTYLKAHSYGEYVFDHGWADAYERAGGRYYPKMQISVPFTPVAGRRLLVPKGPREAELRRLLLQGLAQICGKLKVTTYHVTFADPAEVAAMRDIGLLMREAFQYHWHNDSYESFDDFLGALASRKRKAIRKERRAIDESGIRMLRLTGDDLKPEHWDVFHRFYVDTYDRKWGFPYLTREFFTLLSERLADRVLLVLAEKDGDWIAGALNFKSDTALFGRNWGSAGDFKFLHFETCYYQAIDFAIEHGLKRVEAGTQGPHKVQRGYLPVATWSGHWIADPSFRQAVARFLVEETRAIEQEMKYMAGHSPFRQEADD